jgi:hypothetical protein
MYKIKILIKKTSKKLLEKYNGKRKKNKLTKKKRKNLIYNNNLKDQELNALEYELAVEIDKRTYLQYYWALLKRKNLILFTFYPTNDYNLITIKICLFLISFSLYMTINAFFLMIKQCIKFILMKELLK